jgi:signal peptidase II
MSDRILLQKKFIPLLLTLFVLALDQLLKFLVVKNIPPYSVGFSFFGDFLRIIHVQNSGIAFSMGNTLPANIRAIMFLLVPLCVLLLVLIIYFRNEDFTRLQRWAIAGVLGGGLGNLLDRFIRADGVVDFIDVKFYGIFGFERWPTFNIADTAVIICAFFFLGSILFPARQKK